MSWLIEATDIVAGAKFFFFVRLMRLMTSSFYDHEIVIGGGDER